MLTKPETVDYFRELAARDGAGKRINASIGPFSAYNLIGVLQFMLRNPSLPAIYRPVVRVYIDRFAALFKGTVGEESIRRGGHPEWDPDPDDPGDPAVMAWLAVLADMEEAGATTPVRLTHVDAFILLIMLQSVCRAPALGDGTIARIHRFTDRIRPAFAGEYGEAFIREGNHERWQW